MSLITSLFRLIPPTLRPGYCPNPKTYQQLANDIIGGTRVSMLLDIGSVFYNYGSTTPLPENRGFPWINTTNGLLWIFRDGVWTSPRSEVDPTFRWMWKPPSGTPESDLWSIGGGDGTDPSVTPPTPTTGAMWELDSEMEGVFPIAPGVIPGTSPAVTLTLGMTGGAFEHTLTDDEGAVGQHIHKFGLTNQSGGGSADDAYFSMGALSTVPSFNGFYITGSNGRSVIPQVQADLETRPSGLEADGVEAEPFEIMPPYRVIGGWAKPTGRLFLTLPA